MRKNEIIELLLQEKTLYGIFLKFVEIYNLEESKFEFLMETNITAPKKYANFLINYIDKNEL